MIIYYKPSLFKSITPTADIKLFRPAAFNRDYIPPSTINNLSGGLQSFKNKQTGKYGSRSKQETVLKIIGKISKEM